MVSFNKRMSFGDPDLEFDSDPTTVFQIVQDQINMLKFTAWSTREVIHTLNQLHYQLKTRATWCETSPEQLRMVGHASYKRWVVVLRLYIPEAVRILECDATLFRENWWNGNWVDTYATEHRAICVLEYALRAASPTKSFI